MMGICGCRLRYERKGNVIESWLGMDGFRDVNEGYWWQTTNLVERIGGKRTWRG
jgi:hypothetical protein